MKVALFFGSFNPIHNGHLHIAIQTHKQLNLDAVWFVLTPHSPAKSHTQTTVLQAQDRWLLLRLALWKHPYLRPIDVELKRPGPQYTVDTLKILNDAHPNDTFGLLMGKDNLHTLPTWKQADRLMNQYPLYVYERDSQPAETSTWQTIVHIQRIHGPLLPVSSTQLRHKLQAAQPTEAYLPKAVHAYIMKKGFYQATSFHAS